MLALSRINLHRASGHRLVIARVGHNCEQQYTASLDVCTIRAVFRALSKLSFVCLSDASMYRATLHDSIVITRLITPHAKSTQLLALVLQCLPLALSMAILLVPSTCDL